MCSITLNTALEIGYDISKSHYARFIVKGGSALYDFFTSHGINIVKAIISLIKFFSVIILFLLLTNTIDAIGYRTRELIVKNIR